VIEEENSHREYLKEIVMKKILAAVVVAVVSIIALNCVAGHARSTISIINNTDATIYVSDSNDSEELTVEPGRSASMEMRVREQHGSFPMPSFLLPKGTTITVKDDKGSNSIKIDQNTKSVTVDDGLELSAD